MSKVEIKKIVREHYAGVAREGQGCCPPAARTGEGCSAPAARPELSSEIGYTPVEMSEVPEGANLGLGCGNPVALASLRQGEVVVDLGSGAGFDCFLAARRVGVSGRVIGVDMTPEMLEKARSNARRGGYENVEFRLGEIENLPVPDGGADVILSNCVINLSPDKPRVFREAFRVLRSGGRLMISDLVLTRDLPPSVRNSVEAYAGCIAGALRKDDYLAALRDAGFREVEVTKETPYPLEGFSVPADGSAADPAGEISAADLREAASALRSISVHAVKP